MKTLFLLLVFSSTFGSLAQERLVLNDSVFVRMNGNAYIILENKEDSAITLVGQKNASIISEHEYNKIRWVIGDTTGTYIIPYADSTSLHRRIPFTMTITTAGTEPNGYIDFSTYRTALASVANTNLQWPYLVFDLNLLDNSSSGSSASAPSCVDRFWVVDAIGYSLKPDVVMEMSYAPEEVVAPNSIVEPNLKAYRFRYDDGLNGGWDVLTNEYGTQTSAFPAAKVVNIDPDPANLYWAWTLADLTIPLPVEMTEFSVSCTENERQIRWTTVSESNSDYFDVQKSLDGIHFSSWKTVDAAGNSQDEINYMVRDNEPGVWYYRLLQVDQNGDAHTSNTVVGTNCFDSEMKMFVYPNPTNGVVAIHFSEPVSGELELTTAVGQTLRRINLFNKKQIHINLEDEAPGVYFVSLNRGNVREVVRLIKR